jgi:A/G-specific adenine glycosylase
LAGNCLARQSGEPARYPVKAAKRTKPLRKGAAFWIERNGAVWLVRREDSGMLGGMRALPGDGWSARENGSGKPPFVADWRRAGAVRHGFTHFDLALTVWRATAAEQPRGEGEWWPLARLGEAGLPTLFAKAAARALDHAAAEHQPQPGDGQHYEAEIAPVI